MSSVGVNPPHTPVTKGSNGTAFATLPNVCKMPGPPAPFVPTPLPNIGRSSDSPDGYSTSVMIEGDPVAIQGASFKSKGDVASQGTGGGIVSNNVEGATKFVAPGSMDVKIEGKNVQYLGDQMTNNNGPSGSPANSATLAGLIQGMAIPELGGESAQDLDKIADECNRAVNKHLGHCPAGPKGADCTTAGTAKHKCCEESINKYNKKNPGSCLRSEVPFDEAGNIVSSEAEHSARLAANEAYNTTKASGASTVGVWKNAYFGGGGGARFRADVLVERNGVFTQAFDFKFNCKDEGTANLMSEKQACNYRKFTKLNVAVIHKDGRKC